MPPVVTLTTPDIVCVCLIWVITFAMVGVLSYHFGTTRRSEEFKRDEKFWHDHHIEQMKVVTDKLVRVRKVLDGEG